MSGRLASIDCGTNSIRLLVGEPSGDGTFAIIDRRMRITRLGQGVDATGQLAPEAIERTMNVLREYRAAMDDLGVERVRIAATSAARDAANRDEFFDAAEAARRRAARAAVGQGGGSPVVPRRDGGRRPVRRARSSSSTSAAARPSSSSGTDDAEGVISIDIGCVRLTEKELHHDPPLPEELSIALSMVDAYLDDVRREVPAVDEREDVHRRRRHDHDRRRGRDRPRGRTTATPSTTSV